MSNVIDYYKSDRVSQSKLKVFLESREMYYYKYIVNSFPESDTEQKAFGRYYHTLILEPNLVNEKFVIANRVISGKMGVFIETLAKQAITNNRKPNNYDINTAYKQSEFDNKTWNLDKVLDKFNNTPENQEYFNFLISAKDKEIISKEDVDRAYMMRSKLGNYPSIYSLLYSHETLASELVIEWETSYCNIKLKSMLDKVVIDHSKKIIYILDLKTTKCKNIKQFKKDIIFYKYYIQTPFYKAALDYWLSKNRPDLIQYKVEFIFLPQFSEYPFHCLKPIKLQAADEDKGYLEFREALIELEGCIINNDWESDRKNQDSSGIVTLNCFDYD